MKESFYFSHDYNAHNDIKIESMLFSIGWEGYGLFWAIIEKLAQDSNHKLSRNYEIISYSLRCDSSIIKKVVEDFGLFSFDDDFFWSERLIKNFEARNKKAERAKSLVTKRWGKNKESDLHNTSRNTENNSSYYEPYIQDSDPRNTSRNTIKERKGKEIKGNDIKEKEIIKKEKITAFNKFWELYGKKGSKKIALQRWMNIPKDLYETIYKHVQEYVESTPDMQYRKNADSYLHQNYWESQIKSSKSQIDIENERTMQQQIEDVKSGKRVF